LRGWSDDWTRWFWVVVVVAMILAFSLACSGKVAARFRSISPQSPGGDPADLDASKVAM